MRRFIRFAVAAAFLGASPLSVPAGGSPPADQVLFTGIALAGEFGTCNADGTGTVSGRGLYATGFAPRDRGVHSTFVMDTSSVVSARGSARMRLCLRLTSSPLPTITVYAPNPDIDDINPDEWLFGRRSSSCVDSKAYGGQGTIEFTEFGPQELFKRSHTLQLSDISWKAGAAKHVVALGRWNLAGNPSVGGQLVGLAAFQGGNACFFPDGAQAFTTFGTFSLLQSGTSVRWDDLVEPVDAKDGSGPLHLWGDKTEA